MARAADSISGEANSPDAVLLRAYEKRGVLGLVLERVLERRDGLLAPRLRHGAGGEHRAAGVPGRVARSIMMQDITFAHTATRGSNPTGMHLRHSSLLIVATLYRVRAYRVGCAEGL